MKKMLESRLLELEAGLAKGRKNGTIDYYPPRTVAELVREVRRTHALLDVQAMFLPRDPPKTVVIGSHEYRRRLYSGICMCGHAYHDHHCSMVMSPEIAAVVGSVGPDQCEYFGFNETAGLDEDSKKHCHNYVDADDPDPEVIKNWKGTRR